MDKKLTCDCGLTVSKGSLNRHKRTKLHLERMNMTVGDTPEEEEKETPKEAEKEPKREEVEEEEDEEEDEEEEIVEVKPQLKPTRKGGKSKEHMDAIREKAIMTIKQKKQAKIDQENLIKQKAEQYDVLVKSLKEKEEAEKKRKEEEKLKDIEHKAREYDKMLKQQQRTQAISNMTQGKIIDDIKEQRINYLMRYLSHPSHY
jgi:hypothetical protein